MMNSSHRGHRNKKLSLALVNQVSGTDLIEFTTYIDAALQKQP